MTLTEWLDTNRPNWRTEDPVVVAAWANYPTTVLQARALLTVSECWAAVEPSEYLALTVGERGYLDRIFSGAEVPLGLGPVRSRLAALFGAGTTTRSNLLALYDESVSTTRGREAGIGHLDGSTVRTMQGG